MMENWSEVDISMRVRSPPPPHPHLSGADGALVIRRFRRLVATAKNSGRPSGQGRNSHRDVVRIEHDLVSLRYTGGIRHDAHRPCRSNFSLTSKRFPAPGERSWLLVPSAHGLEPSIRNREGDPYRFEPEVKWVRPDLNRSRQHPKLVGFLLSGKTGGPHAQTN